MCKEKKEEMIKVSAFIQISSPNLPEGITVSGAGKHTQDTLFCAELGEFPFPVLDDKEDFKAPLVGFEDQRTILTKKGKDKLNTFWQSVHNEKIRDLLRSLSGIYPSWKVQMIKLCRSEMIHSPHAKTYLDYLEFLHFEKTSLTPGK